MKVILLLAVLSLATSGTVERPPADPLPIGSPLPKGNVELLDVSGKTISLSQSITGKGLLVMFSCNTCPYVIRNQERTRDICRFALDKGIAVVLLNSNAGNRDGGDSYDDMKAYAQEQHYEWPYAVDKDNELADAFGADRTPQCFLFDGEKKLVYQGAIDDNPGSPSGVTREHLKKAMEEMLANRRSPSKIAAA